MTSRQRFWGVRAAELAVVAVIGVVIALDVFSSPHHAYSVTIAPKAESRDTAGSGCGVERADVKHLTDGFTLPSTPIVMTPDQLVSLAAPAVTQNSPRFTSVPSGSLPETILVELKDVHVIAVKQEADSDLHVIISTPTGAELNVEAPQAQCDSSSSYASILARARAAMDAAMPSVSTSGYTAVNLTATIEGVLFWDVLHGQRGSPNGVELHPVTFFSTGGSPPPPPTTTTVPTTTTTPTPTTTTAPVTTTTPTGGDDQADELPGCVRYPGRVYLHHVKQPRCAAGFFTTP